MGESFIATVQYGDLKGTAAADGFEAGGPLGDLEKRVKLKPGFMAIGFGLTRLFPLDNGRLPVVVFAVDTNEVGVGEELKAYAKKHGQIPVSGFHGEIAPNEFQSIFKRFSLRLHTRGLEADQLTITDWHYKDENGEGTEP